MSSLGSGVDMTQLLSTTEINPTSSPKGSVIWLHGLGADGHDFVPIVKELKLSDNLPVRFIFPNAPSIPVTINNGFVMPAWYDIVTFSVENHADYAGIDASTQKIQQLIEHEKSRGIPAEKIILAGFSQGAVIALATGLTYPERLGGIIALSGYLPPNTLQTASAANQSLPIFLAHGTEDTIVPYRLGENTHQLLQKNHYIIEWHSYQMPHSVCSEEILDIANFIQQAV